MNSSDRNTTPSGNENITPEFEEYLNERLKETEKIIKNGTAYIAHTAEDITKAAREVKEPS